MTRKFLAAALITATLAVTTATAAEARPTRTLKPAAAQCRAEVTVFEDGSWFGGNIYAADGRLVAPQWEVTGPEKRGLDTSGQTPVWNTDFKPTVDGRTCVLVLAN